MAPSATQGFDLDEVLVELGVFSKYQIRNYFLLSIPILVSSIYTLTYLFTALSPPHRCYIPECENLTTTEIYPYWIRNAIPYNDNIPSKCTRFRYQVNETDFLSSNDTCPFNDFDRATEIKCEQLYIDTTHTSIAHDFNLFCDERWKLGLPGTIHNVGQFCSMLVTGVISDRFGRRFAITAGIVASAIFGIARSYSVSFLWFLIWEFLDAAFGSGAFISSFVLVTELVIPSKRSLVSVYLWTAFPVGEFLLGIIAWKVADWRHLLRYLYFPGLLFVVYLWIIPESVRWLISKNRFQEAEDILKQAATKSDITLSVMNLTKAEVTETPANSEKELNKIDQHYPLKEALQHPTILIRLVVCSTCWIICVFVNYGISLNSVSISGNGYVNFMVIAMMGLPGNILCYFCVNKFGRRGSLCGGFLVTGLACMMIIFGEAEFSQLKLVGYGVGKCTMTMVFGVLYLFTAELFPTPLRHTLFGTCSMFGRVGSILAPQLSFLADTVWYQLPTVLFGVTTLIAASLSLLLPETLNIKLPDTIEESVQIGKKQKNPTCYIPECENLTTTEIYPYWIRNAIPYNDNIPSKCTRFRYQVNETDFLSSNDTCPFNDFDRATEIKCEQLYIDTTHTSIAHDFNLFCDERWKLGLPGTIHNVGQFCSMLVTGVISDRFGRRFAITAGIVASAIFGIARSYSVSFLWFLIWEFLDAAFGSGAFISSFVLVTELVIPSKRSLVSVYLWTAFPVGEFLLGIIAWKVADWRHLLRYLYFPGLLFVVYLWIIPESVRWLISKNRFQEAEDILKQAATKSDITLSVMNLTKAEVTETPANSEKELNKIDQHYPLKEALQHPTILIRLVVCSTCWIICVFVNYGISLNSVSISGNGYVNFMVIAMMGLPGNILCYFCVNKFGRRGSLCGGFLVTGLACMMIIFGEAEFSQLKLVGYGVGKCTMTMVFGVLYLFTAELFPTPLRHTLFGTCSMFGRVGSILAPQLSFLADTVWYQLPTVLFGVTTLIAASLSLLLPETLNIKLPDTIEESVQIGKKQKNPT